MRRLHEPPPDHTAAHSYPPRGRAQVTGWVGQDTHRGPGHALLCPRPQDTQRMCSTRDTRLASSAHAQLLHYPNRDIRSYFSPYSVTECSPALASLFSARGPGPARPGPSLISRSSTSGHSLRRSSRTSPTYLRECQASYRSVGGWYSNRGFGAIKAMRRFRGTAAKPHRCTLIPQP